MEDEAGEERWGVVVEDADGEVVTPIEEGVNNVGRRFVCAEAVGAIPVVEGIGRLALAGVDVGLPPVHLGAVARVWRELAASESGEMVAWVRRGLCDGE